jgi:endonuclease/exonuclease/phosphatase family metal-dependent hydrolase
VLTVTAASVCASSRQLVAAAAACRTAPSSTVRLSWTLPTGSFDRAALDRWCAGVGPAVVQNLASPHSRQPATGVTVVTWNTHVGAGDIAALIAELRQGDLTGTPATEFVLLLQEVVRHGAEVPMPLPPGAAAASRIGFEKDDFDVIEAARTARLNVAYVPSMRNGADAEDRGNAVLTTLPITAIENIELPFGRQRRVAIAATLASGSGDPAFRVVNAHFDTALRLGVGGPASWRRLQADALLNAITEATVPTIVAGDFNTWWGNDEPAVDDLRRRFPAASDRVTGDTWRGPLAMHAQLDHMFAAGWDSPLEVRRAARRFGSDHYPLYVVIARASRAG